MYSYIKGQLADITSENTIVVEAGGIGYSITVPMPTLDSFFEIGQEVKIYTYLQVREDAMKLFGFVSKQDEQLFEMLISVNGIGPKGAISILSTMTTDELRYAILGADDKAISKVPGIGAKTAQRLIIDLKDKFSLDDAFTATFEADHLTKKEVIPALGQAAELKNTVIEALVALGFSQTEVIRISKNMDYSGAYSEEELIKQALSELV